MPKHPRPSSTAWLIAAATLFGADDPVFGSLIPPAAVEPTRNCLRASRGLKRWLVPLFRRSLVRRYLLGLEQRTLPGFVLHIATRKRYIEDAVRRALADGFRQVIILGAGYDTLALRLHREFPKVTFIEVDHPGTQRIKLACAMTGALPSSSLALIGADLATHDLREALAACPIYKAAAETIFIAEGLLMYLPAATVDTLFSAMRTQGGRRNRVIFTFLEPGKDGRATFPSAGPRLEKWLQKQGEPFDWGIRRESVPAWLQQRGYTPHEIAGPQTFRQRILTAASIPEDERLAAGEYACSAERK